MQQYLAQGQLGINPGQMQVAASDPISAAGGQQFGADLANILSNMSGPTPYDPAQAQNALQQGAQAQPNVNGQNMGSVGPTQQTMQAMQNPNFAQQVPTYQQQLGNFLQGS